MSDDLDLERDDDADDDAAARGDGWENATVVDEPVVDSEGRLVCDECQKTFKNRRSLNEHKREYHRKDGRQPRTHGRGSSEGSPRRGTPKSGNRQERRARQVRETLQELTAFSDELRGRSTEPAVDLADVIRRDAVRIAESISWVAERFNPLGTLIDWTTGHGGVITIARGFSGVGRWVTRRWRTMIADGEQQPVEGVVYLDELSDEQRAQYEAQTAVDGEPGVPPLV